MKTKLIISALAFLAITTLVSGQNTGVPSRPKNCAGKGIAYVDANNNGICDNFENSTSNKSVASRNGNCRFCANGQRQSLQRQGQAQGQGRGRGQGRRLNFVDADKNGICDYYEAANKR